VAVLPAFAAAFGVGMEFSQFYGGTSLLIMVGVIIDTIQQIDSYLLMQHYESMMETDNVAGNTGNIVVPS
jgi:preprotein translocase subunit SecY